MINFNRVLAVLRKDVTWAKGNIKLLAVMVLPVFLVVFFSKLDSAATFGFSLIFVNAFVGIFSTSYLIIEEKNKGTLLALLTTPLTGSELLLGKFLFNLILCLSFSIFAILLNNRLDILLNPLILLNILFFAGTTCFFGYVLGVFFKNEQEMSVLAPFLMLLFCFGDAADKISDKNNIHAFFPDYFLAQSVKDVPWNWSALLTYNLFSFTLFAIAFLMAVTYTHFYFSNNREKRFSASLIINIGLFVSVLVVSGLFVNSGNKIKLNQEGLQKHNINTTHWSAKFHFNPQKFRVKNLLQSRSKSIALLSPINSDDYNIVFAIREAASDEGSSQARAKKVMEDPKRQLVSQEKINGPRFQWQRWVYTKDSRFYVITESFCKNHILQISMDQKLISMAHFPAHFRVYKELMAQLELTCHL